ncbi:unnamed protein product [Hymenolepis diminuta]|uniref:Uncharacterized protein n=1 Tax=Hymenolepis diminuta TaxID=6216 RepID=A0A564XUX7_HYMDI|nr:unnamed protein product [Hymenolepis diminuta]
MRSASLIKTQFPKSDKHCSNGGIQFYFKSSPKHRSPTQVIVKGVQSIWTSSCSHFQGGSTFSATCHFVGRDFHCLPLLNAIQLCINI